MKDYSSIKLIVIPLIFLTAPYLSYAKDSAGLTSGLPSSDINARYSSPTTLAPNIKNEDYNSLPGCNKVNLNYCPDINGNYLSTIDPKQAETLAEVYCPSACTATRTTQGSGWTMTSVSAVCPPGYTSVAQFNMRPEYVYYSTMTDLTPIIGLATYNFYTQTGLPCTPLSTTPLTYTDTCNASSRYAINQIVDNFPSSPTQGMAVQIVSVQKICYVTSDCKAATIPCNNPLANSSNYLYNAYPLTCSAMGMTPTGYTVPTTLVCARVAPTWKYAN